MENGENILTIHQYQNWFPKFCSDNFDIKDAPRFRKPAEADEDKIKAFD